MQPSATSSPSWAGPDVDVILTPVVGWAGVYYEHAQGETARARQSRSVGRSPDAVPTASE
jgi:hypothetical protein